MRFSDEQKQQFEEDGYLIIRKLFSDGEMNALVACCKSDADMTRAAESVSDGDSSRPQPPRMIYNNYLQDDISSAFVASRRVVDNVEFLLDDEVYHFHHKMMLKAPRVGVAWEWHQDYGYWYASNHCLYPDMLSCAIAVDPCTRENGCMQVLKGSQKCGRIEHMSVNNQTGADPERVELLLERHDLVYATMDPGDALFFHVNTLHRSDPNLSEHSRWILIGCYNTKHNSPFVEGSHPQYHPLKKVNDEDLMDIARSYAGLDGQVAESAIAK
jgi:ectoine hydroxylase-related dioxygenase (phytanoyl-CoA dioxygenase family)